MHIKSISIPDVTLASLVPPSSHNRQGNVEPFTLVEGPEAWYADEYRGRDDWVTVLSPAHIAELDAAVQVRVVLLCCLVSRACVRPFGGDCDSMRGIKPHASAA